MNEIEKIKAARDEAAIKAYKALAKYKYWMFGYWAAAWSKYNKLLPTDDKQASPFPLVALAREKL